MLNKKIVAVIITILILSSFNLIHSNTVSAEEIEYVRIGLKMPRKSDFQANLTSENGFVVGTLNQDFTELAALTDNNYIARMDGYYDTIDGQYTKAEDLNNADIGPFHIEINQTYPSYNEALNETLNLRNSGIEAYPVYDQNFKIWIGRYKSAEEANHALNTLTTIPQSLNVIQNLKPRVYLEDSHQEIALMLDVSMDLYIKGTEVQGKPPVTGIEEYLYRDYITFSIYDNELTLINYVQLNHYLYGVVPREMSASWHMEALKAQAIAARNYAILNIHKHGRAGYDLCDTQDCQVYGGYKWENTRTNEAVEQTSKELILYNSKPIYAYYHSSSGGHTENSENIWSFPVPYLKGVEDSFSLGSPNDTWSQALGREEIQQKLTGYGYDLGDIIMIEPIEYSQFGRVLKLRVKGTKGTEVLEKEKVRLIFGTRAIKSTWYNVNTDADVYVMTGDASEPQKTTLAEHDILSDSGVQTTSRSYTARLKLSNGSFEHTVSVVPNQYVFDGKGWGHGLGMSQWGAKKMAELGYTYDKILEYYYTGTIVQ